MPMLLSFTYFFHKRLFSLTVVFRFMNQNQFIELHLKVKRFFSCDEIKQDIKKRLAFNQEQLLYNI